MSRTLIKLISLGLACAMMLVFPAATLAESHETTGTQTEGADTTETSVSTEPIITKTAVTETGTPLESLNVSYWPEYDRPSVLVIYRGTLDDSIKVPATLKIAIPKGSDVDLVATSAIDPSGTFQYDEAWNSKQLVDAGDMTILTYQVIHREFQLEIYMKPVSGRGKRDYNFALPSISDIQSLQVDIREPVRAEKFKATPAAARTSAEGGFKNHFYSFSDVTPGQQYAFKVSYDRADSKPSVDQQTGIVDTSGGSGQTAIILLLVLAGVGALIGVGVWRMRAAPVTPARGRPVKGKTASGNTGKGKGKGKGGKGKGQVSANQNKASSFCSNCGAKAKTGAKFCPECGENI